MLVLVVHHQPDPAVEVELVRVELVRVVHVLAVGTRYVPHPLVVLDAGLDYVVSLLRGIFILIKYPVVLDARLDYVVSLLRGFLF